LEHGEWQAWLAENFDLSLRTAQNYCAAAEYVARAKGKSATVADFANLSPSVLYHLAAGHFDERVEAAILAGSRKGRIDEDAAWAIDEKLAPPDDDDDADDADDQEDGDEDRHDSGDEKNAESEAILDGPPPAVAPTADPTRVDFALQDFDHAISALKRLMTKPSAQFTCTIHTVNDLENVESFMRAVTKAKAAAASVDPETPPVPGQREAPR
jgi:hypothetical protein